jgi:hypothetical protein
VDKEWLESGWAEGVKEVAEGRSWHSLAMVDEKAEKAEKAEA